MQVVLIFGAFFVFMFLIVVPEAYSDSQIYENPDYGFTIEYPSNWILNETIPQKNKWIEIVSFTPPTEEWFQGIYVNKWIGDLKNKIFDSNEYLDTHNKAAQEWCSSISLEKNGFECKNYFLVDKQSILISGRESFLLEENWTRIEGNQNSTITVYNLQIPDGNDRWTVIGEGKATLISEESNVLKNSLNSFTLLNPIKSEQNSDFPSPKSQFKNNISLNEISCNQNLVLIFKATDGSPACVKSFSVEKLIQRGWASSQ